MRCKEPPSLDCGAQGKPGHTDLSNRLATRGSRHLLTFAKCIMLSERTVPYVADARTPQMGHLEKPAFCGNDTRGLSSVPLCPAAQPQRNLPPRWVPGPIPGHAPRRGQTTFRPRVSGALKAQAPPWDKVAPQQRTPKVVRHPGSTRLPHRDAIATRPSTPIRPIRGRNATAPSA